MKVFIDGESGTVGLQIYERLENRSDIELLKIAPELSENADERKKFLNAADFVFLCLPDEAAKQSVSLINETGNTKTRIIDASTAHRTHPDWTYGFPELSKEREEEIRISKRVATPGCYASGFVALVYPLVKAGIIKPDFPVYSYGISGYSGAGKAFIEEYKKADERIPAKLYALDQNHKHLPEMEMHGGLTLTPMFNPVIDNFYSGMVVNVPLQTCGKFGIEEVSDVYKKHYIGGRVKFKGINANDAPLFAVNELSGSDDMEIYVFGSDERILLTARFDNLGKGASGAAVQCFDIMKGKE
ncbi:MAG: N-acetyl-gamma-glutamyl-phosphate reductase [Oscillospiraceae bacterium]|nr:N-acetyl-gamma-glutamyl-phosphate reductase [Oscillospiraceae bacterium]